MKYQWMIVPLEKGYAILFSDGTYFTGYGVGNEQQPVLFNTEAEAKKLDFFGFQRVEEFSEEARNVSM